MSPFYEQMSDEELEAFRQQTAATLARIENEQQHDVDMNKALIRLMQAADHLAEFDEVRAANPDAAQKLLKHAVMYLGHSRVLVKADKEVTRRAVGRN